jgi:hypothetical protein
MTSPRPLDSRAVGLMLVLCAIWGLQQVVLKATATDIAPIWQIGLRSAAAAALVGLVMLARGERMRLSDGIWRAGLVVGLLFGLEFLLVAEGLRPCLPRWACTGGCPPSGWDRCNGWAWLWRLAASP